MNDDAELSELRLLSLMLNESTAQEAITAVLPRLKGAEFTTPKHQAVFEAVLATHAARQPILPEVVARFLDPAFKRGQTQGVALLWEIVCAPQLNPRVHGAMVSSVDYYVDEILRFAKARQLTQLGARMQQSGELNDEPVEVANYYLDDLRELARPPEVDHETAVDVMDAMAAIDSPKGVDTPWHAINNLLGGWRPGTLTVVGARPGIGKSVFGVQAILDIARRVRDEQAIMFSLEMSATEVYHRMFSSIAGVEGTRITDGCHDPSEYKRVAAASDQVKHLPLLIDPRTALSLEQISARIVQQKRRQPVSLVVVDYLTLISPPSYAPKNDRRVQVDAIAQGLKNIAHEEQIPVVALAQVNRGSEQRHEKLPVLSDLRESGGIEAAADAVILMHREQDPAEGDVEDLSLRIAKNRYGPLGTVHLRFLGQYSRILDVPRGLGSPPIIDTPDAPEDPRAGRG